MPTKKRQQNAYQVNKELNLVVRKKRADVKIASVYKRRNPVNINSQKLKKAQNELT